MAKKMTKRRLWDSSLRPQKITINIYIYVCVYIVSHPGNPFGPLFGTYMDVHIGSNMLTQRKATVEHVL